MIAGQILRLETQHLRLRSWRESDSEAFAALNSDVEIMEDYGGPLSRFESDQKLKRFIAAFDNYGFGRWLIEDLEDNFLGYAGVYPSRVKHPLGDHDELGWRLMRRAWGHGYATEAARASLDDVFGRIGLKEVIAYTSSDNIRSQAVIARLNMQRDPPRDFTLGSTDTDDTEARRRMVWMTSRFQKTEGEVVQFGMINDKSPIPIQSDPDEASPLRLLLVDANKDAADTLAKTLAARGYAVKLVGNASKAHAAVETFEPDVVLVDSYFGKVNGLDFINQIRSRHPHLICILLIDNSEVEMAIEAMKHGLYDFFRKPIAVGLVETALWRAQAMVKERLEKWKAHEALREAHNKLEQQVEELLVAQDEAIRANRAKSDLMANMSHELRTPLNAIIGFSETMKFEVFGPLGNDKYREYLGDIHHSGQHLLELINDILDISAFEAGAMELHEDNVSLTDIIEISVRLITQQAEVGKISVASTVEGDIPIIYADPRRVEQVFLNLLSNAVKFTPEGGEVRVTANVNDDGSLAVCVADTGMGMDSEEITKALSTFGQVDSGLNRKFEGSGLGLPLTKGLMELHGGTLEIKSQKGNGTLVTVTFPKECVIQNV